LFGRAAPGKPGTVSLLIFKIDIMSQKINIILFGIGNVGSALINKALKSRKALLQENNLDIKFPVITNETMAFFEKEGAGYKWEANFIQFAVPFKIQDIVDYVSDAQLENLVAIDTTDSLGMAEEYPGLINNGFSIISVNETVSKLPPSFGKSIRIEAEYAALEYELVNLSHRNREEAATVLLQSVTDIAGRKKALAS
jgi:homoserine dehydrogenase